MCVEKRHNDILPCINFTWYCDIVQTLLLGVKSTCVCVNYSVHVVCVWPVVFITFACSLLLADAPRPHPVAPVLPGGVLLRPRRCRQRQRGASPGTEGGARGGASLEGGARGGASLEGGARGRANLEGWSQG